MKKIYFALIVTTILTGVSVTIQIRPAYNYLKQEINSIFTKAIEVDLVQRLHSSDATYGVPPIANTEKLYDLTSYIDSPYSFFTNTGKELHSKLRTAIPINPATLDKILNSILEQKGLKAETSIRYTDIKENSSTYNRNNHVGTIPSAIIKTGTANEIEIQAFITPSFGWIITTTSGWMEINLILFVLLICIDILFLILKKQHNKKTGLTQLVTADSKPDLHNEVATSGSLQTKPDNTPQETELAPINKTIVKLDNGDYQIGLFYLDNKKQLLINGNISLCIGKKREYLFLVTLLKAKNHTVSVEKMAEVLGIKNYKDSNQLNESTSRLRKLLKSDPHIEIARVKNNYVLSLTNSS